MAAASGRPRLAARPWVAAIRRRVNRAGYDVTRAPFDYRLVGMLSAHGVDTVVDVGANTGQFATTLRHAGFRGRIVSLEPLAEAYAALQATAAADPDWTAVRAAASDAPGTVVLHVSANSVSSSALPMLPGHEQAAPDSRYVGTEEVPATTVDAVVAEHRIDPARTLLKVDVQGYEESVLRGAAQTLPAVAALQLELSVAALYDGQAMLWQMVPRLADAGLDLWHLEPAFEDLGSGRVLQYDGTFFRR